VLGPKIVPLIYLSTVLALTLSFVIGRLVPQRAIVDLFGTLPLHWDMQARTLRDESGCSAKASCAT
jgi:cadmium resistance protein CadD (predicted permease)